MSETEVPYNNTTTDELNYETTQQLNDTTTHTTKSRPTTTVDIASLIEDRNRLKQESDSLRVAVIILGIISVIAVIAAIIFVIWMILRRIRSGKMESKAEMYPYPSNRRHPNTQSYIQKLNDSQSLAVNPDEVIQEQREITGTANPVFNDYVDSEKSTTAGLNKDFLNEAATSADPKYLTFECKSNPTITTESDDNNVYIISDNNNDQEIYEVVSHERSPFPDRHNLIAVKSESTTSPPESIEEVAGQLYANCADEAPEADGNYSALETESQYDHFYN